MYLDIKGSQLTIKIQAVTEWPRPTTVTEVRSFLGFVNYYRWFILNFFQGSKAPKQTLAKFGRDFKPQKEILSTLGTRAAGGL